MSSTQGWKSRLNVKAERLSHPVVIGVNGPAVVKGQPPEVSRMDEANAPNRATEKPVEESFSSPGVEWAVNGKARKPRNPGRGKVGDCLVLFIPIALIILVLCDMQDCRLLPDTAEVFHCC